mgnify:CR=1 FL=1
MPSLYDASVPVLIRGLNNLSAILDKAEAHAAAGGPSTDVLAEMRLAPDMLPLARQIHLASDSAKGCGARLAGVPVPSYPDTEKTFAELKQRIARTVDFLEGLDAAQVDGAEDRTVTLKLGGKDVAFTARDYLFGFVVPNFFFHVTTAYAILRHAGVPLGKRDYLGLA